MKYLIFIFSFMILFQTTHAFSASLSCSNLFEERQVVVEDENQKSSDVDEKLHAKTAKAAAAVFKKSLKIPNLNEVAEQMNMTAADLHEFYGSKYDFLKLIQETNPEAIDIVSRKIVAAYIKAAKEKGELPTVAEIAKKAEIDPKDLARLIGPESVFKNLREITTEAYKENQKAFENVRDTDYFTKEREEKTLQVIRESPNVIVTTAVAGMPVDAQVLNALLKVAKEKDAPLLVFPSEMKTTGLDPILLKTANVHIITNSIQLNESLRLNTANIQGTAVNPLVGKEFHGKRGESQIFGSPKMHLKTLSTYDNHIQAHMLYTTGAITKPYYNKGKPTEKQKDTRAKEDHRYGALILEKSMGSDRLLNTPMTGIYHIRQLKYDSARDGFMDLNKFYSPSEVRKERALAVIYGDLHFGETDRQIEKQMRDDILADDPDFVVTHDSGNGKSVSHWDTKDYVLMAQKAKDGKLDVRKELMNDIASFNAILRITKRLKIVVVFSNHDAWLSRWVREKAYMTDPYNSELGDELAAMMKKDPSIDAYAYFIAKYIDDPSRIIFLAQGDSFKAGTDDAKVELSLHGDKGTNGARGSMRTYQIGTDGSITGHTHTPEIKNEHMNAGLTALKVLDYTRGGLSSWAHGKVRVSLGGIGQFLQFQYGEWNAQSTPTASELQNFSSNNMPQVITNVDDDQRNQEDLKSTFDLNFDDGDDVSDLAPQP